MTSSTFEETLDRLTGAWWIYQLRRGHRYTTDDILTAWTALQARPEASNLLDLGSGLGSVGLIALWSLPTQTRLVSIERQEISVQLALKTVAHNDLQGRVDVRHFDLRDEGALRSDETFELITANPPYLPPERGSHSDHPQKAEARFELHGNVFDYCRIAKAHLASQGRFVLCFPINDPRAEEAIDASGLVIRSQHPIVFRAGQPPHLALYECAHDGVREDRPPLLVRDERRHRTEAYCEILRDVGMIL